ncbi:MAG: DUF6481 family protein [Caulobacteraceae bacterium]|nr:DUF6481 family protein [Caulobacteraceae bacterium]
MQEPKRASFADRLATAAEAKKARLAKFTPKPTVTDPNFQNRQQRRAAEIEAVRAAREAEREAARLAQLEAQQAAHQASLEAELSELDAKRQERKDRKAQVKAEARANREAKAADRRK